MDMKGVVLLLRRIHGWICMVACGVGFAQGQVVLNEIMADNLSALANEDTHPDWVEVSNAGGTPMDLSGWGLSDELGQPSKYTLPAGTILNGGESILIFLDNEVGLPGLHAGFSLDSKGELLALYHPSNPFSPVDLISFGLQLPDYPIGRIPHLTGSWVLTLPTPGEMNVAAPVASTTNLSINEWMAAPSSGEDWLELFNRAGEPVSLGGLVFTDNAVGVPSNRAVPLLSFIGAEGYLQFIADDLDEPDADHLDFRLSNNGETVTLYEADRVTVVNRVMFGSQASGVSQGRLPDGDPNIVDFAGGRDTPGASNFLPLTNVVVNEVLSHSDDPLEDAIELVNRTGVPVDLSYWWISDSRNTPRKYRIPFGTVLPAFGFKVFYEYQFNPNGMGESPSFSLNSSQGDDVFLATGDVTGRLTGFQGRQEFDPADNGVSIGRHINSQGKEAFVAMSRRTFGMDDPLSLAEFRTGTGLNNAPPLVGPLVINEIMYHPPGEGGDNTRDEYIEILNLTNVQVTLYDPDFPTNTWRLANGVEFVFPQFVSLPPGGGLLVVHFDPSFDLVQLNAFRAAFGVPVGVPIYGPYSGKLDNRGESVELYKPDTPQGAGQPDAGFVPYLLADRVDYEDRDPWPEGSEDAGMSLQRRAPEAYGDEPLNWMAAPPSAGVVLVRIDSLEISGNSGTLVFRQVAGRSYAVQTKDTLGVSNWGTVSNYLAVPSTTLQEFTMGNIQGSAARFYRIVTPSP